jgi:hypothetical protein
VFEKYWDYLPDLTQHPDFSSETSFCQEQMIRLSAGLSRMDLSEFEPSVAAQAKQSDVETARDAAISRLRPIQGGLDFWGMHGGAVTGSGAPALGRDRHNVATRPEGSYPIIWIANTPRHNVVSAVQGV